jgi:imidazole glycerol-phosphate synthase subunit HisF
MLRKRLVTILTFNEGVLFRTKLFKPDYRYTANFVDTWSVDEIVVLDVTRPVEGAAIDRGQFHEVLRSLARRCFVPLSAGGGVRNHEDVRRLLARGADKVVVNTGALERPELITEIAESFGTQSVILSIDARRAGDGYEVMSDFGSRPTGLAPETWARRGAELGAGEILVTSIERDGSLSGYDIALCRRVVDNVDVPVLISGGAGSWSQFVEGIAQGGASAVCTSNIFHFTEASLASAKNFMAKAGIPVRR